MKDIFNNNTIDFDNVALGINTANPKPVVAFAIRNTDTMTANANTESGKLYITEKGVVLSGKLIAENRDSLSDAFAPTGVLSSLTLDLSPQGELYIKNSTTNTRIGDLIAIGGGDGVTAITTGDSFGLIKVDGTNVPVKNVSASTVSGPITYANKRINLYPAGTTSSNGTVAVLVTAATIVSDGLSAASTSNLGGIKVDGTTFTVNSSNLIALTGYSVVAGTNNVRNITIGGTTTTISGNAVHVPTATYVGNTATEDNKIVKKSDLSTYATQNYVYEQVEEVHDLAMAAVLKWS